MEDLIYEIFIDMPRQGPGDKASTLKAFSMIPQLYDHIRILDIGCGTGAQTIDLAAIINGKIIAIDNSQLFLDKLNFKAKEKGLDKTIETQYGDMFDLRFDPESFDLIWSEGSVYVCGMQFALKNWGKFIKPGGYMVVSEFNWLLSDFPKQVNDFFAAQSAQLSTINETKELISLEGYDLLGNFTIPECDWDDYYAAIESRISFYQNKKIENVAATELIDSLLQEIELYRKYPGVFGYAFYIIKKKL